MMGRLEFAVDTLCRTCKGTGVIDQGGAQITCPGCGGAKVVRPAAPDLSGAQFDGSTYVPVRGDEPDSDQGRLAKQLTAVLDLMLDGEWHTLSELAGKVGGSEAGVSARLRDLRKPRFGSMTVQRRYVGHGLHEYRLASFRITTAVVP